MGRNNLWPLTNRVRSRLGLVFLATGILFSGPRCKIEESREGAGTELDFALQLVNGTTLDAADFFGSVVLVNFWDTQCGACHAEQDDLNLLYVDYHAQGFEIIGVALARAGVAAVADYLSEYQVTYTSGVIGPSIETRLGRPATIPHSILINRSGRIAEVISGGREYDEFVTLLLPLLNQ